MSRSVAVSALIALILTSSSLATGPVDTDRQLASTTRSNCLRAIEVLDAATDAHGLIPARGDVARVTFNVEGGRTFAGDASAATMVREYEVDGHVDIAAGMTHASYTFWFDPTVKRNWVINGEHALTYRSYIGEDPSDTAYRLYSYDEDNEAEIIVHLLPQELLRQAQKVRQSVRHVGEQTIDGRIHDVIAVPRANGISASLLIDRKTKLVSRAEELFANNGRGDTTRWYDYSDWCVVAGLTLPGHYESRSLARNSFQRVSLDFTDYKLESTWIPEPYEVPREIAAKTDGWMVQPPDTEPDPATYWGWPDGQSTIVYEQFKEVTMIAQDLYLLRMPYMDSQVMFYEFDEYIAVFEAPINSATGRLVIDTIREHTTKPIRYISASHHHDHYFGGLRPFIHDGVTVVAAPENTKYIAHLAAWPHKFIPDELDGSPATPVFKVVDKHLTLADDNHRVEIYDVGFASSHTEEYLVFYFPNAKVLFNGDLIGFRTSGVRRTAHNRTKGLYNLIKRENLDVEWIYNSWPINEGAARRGTMAELLQTPDLEDPE